ncbi:MAG: LarC family nickel insertion protein [Desulfovibrio sp.]|nr:LarC family nickel insertion protein [Desulfovibrio sp.]
MNSEDSPMHMYLDCTHGISGDMTLAVLSHLGVNLAPFTKILADAGIVCQISVRQENRAAGPGCCVDVTWEDNQPLRHPADIAAIFQKLAVSEVVRDRSLAALEALTLAEAHAHQIPPEAVHFHEVGAIDTLADIAGACWALERLGIDRITASPLPWFSGSVRCAHGLIPLPAPAAAYLMCGKPVRAAAAPACEELVTPTGAALLHVLAQAFEEGPEGRLAAIGTGYGSRPAPAGLRAVLFEPVPEQCPPLGGSEYVLQLETHLDHLTGEELGLALEALAALPQTLDVLWLPGVGKKNRPAGLLRVLCALRDEHAVSVAVLRHTHTLGLRRQAIERAILPREVVLREQDALSLAAKAYTLEGARYERLEADSVREAAERLGVGAPALRFR